jgi:hypothetical protein
MEPRADLECGLVRISLGPWTRTRLRLDDEALAGELPPFELGERG